MNVNGRESGTVLVLQMVMLKLGSGSLLTLFCISLLFAFIRVHSRFFVEGASGP
jgi:hypothetical protein